MASGECSDAEVNYGNKKPVSSIGSHKEVFTNSNRLVQHLYECIKTGTSPDTLRVCSNSRYIGRPADGLRSAVPYFKTCVLV